MLVREVTGIYMAHAYVRGHEWWAFACKLHSDHREQHIGQQAGACIHNSQVNTRDSARAQAHQRTRVADAHHSTRTHGSTDDIAHTSVVR